MGGGGVGVVIRYTDTLDGLTPARLRGFFVDWPNPPTPETHLRLLSASQQVLLALDEETGDVVGFATAVSDGVLSAYVSFLEVLPSRRGQGIGTELMRRMLDRLDGLYMVDLLCDPELQPFYARLGMAPAAGMLIRRRERQAGVPPSGAAREPARPDASSGGARSRARRRRLTRPPG
jgi:GNAT superfamily N-acetyltransferase